MAQTKVWIGNISYETTQELLREKFIQFGPLRDLVVMMDKETGKSRGFAFATYREPDHAQAAVAGMNGFRL
ncbi:RNA binding motif protein 3, partial [Atractiella rhizophila]